MAAKDDGPDAILVALFCLLIRWCVSLEGYSGRRAPPMFGDYEAQRHWMEITFHLPVGDWYRDTPSNNLQYWGLDYPPLTAYVSYVCGAVCQWLEPASVALGTSHGYESETHKALMRFTVLVLDALVFFPATFWLSKHLRSSANKATVAGLVLLQPSLILIDHGHFQYNCVSLGLACGAAAALLEGRDVAASVLFCLSLNFKQMSLYYAPGGPFLITLFR